MNRVDWATRNIKVTKSILANVDFKTEKSKANTLGYLKGCQAMIDFVDDDILDLVELAHARELPKNELAGFLSAIDMYLFSLRDEISNLMSQTYR